MVFSGYLKGKETSSRSAVFIAQLKRYVLEGFYCS